MGNSTTSHLPSYNGSCLDANISRDSITPEYWDTASISPDFKIASIVLATIMLLFLAVGVPSNLILIGSIIFKHLYKEPTHILLLNLAIADVLVCVLFMPIVIVSGYAGSFVFGSSDKMRCQVCQFGLVFPGLSIVSINILGLISIDRFIFIKFPFRYERYVTPTKTLVAVIMVWFFSAVQSLLPLIGFGEIRYTYSLCSCQPIFYGSTHITQNIYYLVVLVLLGLIPVTVMIVTNVWIVKIVKAQIKKLYKTRRSFRNRSQLQSHQQSIRKEIAKTKNKKQLAVLRAFGSILIANVITWSPFIAIVVTFLVDRDSLLIGAYMCALLTFISHSILHPIIEGYLIPEIRRSFKKIFCPCNGKLRRNSQTH